MAIINGKNFVHSQIIVNILEVPVASVSEISYAEEQTKENTFGTSPRPVGRGAGAIDASGSITISMTDVEKIRDVAPGGSLLRIEPFTISVTFLNTGGRTVTHKLKDCEFTTDGVTSSQGDTDVTMSFDLIMSKVQYR